MEKKIFEVEVYFIISHMKKATPYLFLVNAGSELGFFKKTFKQEGVGFHDEKAKGMIKDYLVSNILAKGVFVESQRMTFEKAGRRKFSCKYYVSLTEPKSNLKSGSFVAINKAISIKNNMSNFLRTFLVNYIEEKKDPLNGNE